jgi:hypothetical protein
MALQVHRRSRRSIGPRGAWARYLNMLLALWLIVSAFAWRHTPQAQSEAWAIGALVFVCSLWALLNPAVRWLNALCGVWLFFTAISIPALSRASPINDAIVAIAIFLLSWVPGERLGSPRPPTELRT